MKQMRSRSNMKGVQLGKFALLIATVLLIVAILLQSYLIAVLASSEKTDLTRSLLQVTPDTPTPTATSTATTTPTLTPVTIAFQNGVSPSAAYSGMVDTYISQKDSFGNFGLSPTLVVNGETTNGAADANYALLLWDISQIPAGSEVLSASISFNVSSPTVDTYPIYELLKPWVFNQANWINSSGGQTWELPGASGPTDRGSQVLGSFAPSQNGQYNINLNRAIVQAWVNSPTQNNGIIIADSTGSLPSTFDSVDTSIETNRPKLTIQFSYPPGTTATPTFTVTPTLEPTLTETSTATATSIGTATSTATPTVSGTPPTPTVTGTILPNINIVKSVSPTQATIGQLFNFAIQITNSSLAQITDVVVTDTMPSVLTVTGAQITPASATNPTTLRTYTIVSNTITFNLVRLNPGESVTLGILAQINSTATTNTNYQNQATMNFKILNVSNTKNSNTIQFRVLGTSTLPPTGIGGVNVDSGNSSIVTITFGIAAILLLLGVLGLLVGQRAKRNQSQWTNWLTRTSIILLVAAMVFGIAAWGLYSPKNNSQEITGLTNTDTPLPIVKVAQPDDISYQFLLPTSTPEVLPDYPIPSPTPHPSQDDSADTSAVEQIQIPALGLDTVVKFVPFDGFTWQIAGLKQEVAWLGETSWPGLGKNTALAGHVTLVDGSNGPFRYLADLQNGDIVSVSTQENVYTYKVREQIVVEDADFDVLKETNEPQLTLITCTNWDKDLKVYLNRLVVFADLLKIEPIKSANLGN